MRVHRALHDAEDAVARALDERRAAARGPAHGEAHRGRRLVDRRGIGRAFVECHRDVGIEQMLDLDRALGCQRVLGTVEMRLERDAVLVELAQLRQREHLIATRIRQDRFPPVHQRMQAAQPRHALGARAQHQVIGIAQQDLGARRGDGFRLHGLHRRGRAHRHEGRRLDGTAPRGHAAAARSPVARQKLEAEAAHDAFSIRLESP